MLLSKGRKSALIFFTGLVTFCICSFLLLLSGTYLYLAPKLPSVNTLRDVKLQTPLRIYSKNLKLIGEFGEKKRIPIALRDTPPLFIKAILAAEDDRFYEHGGFDSQSLLRAATQLVSSGEIQSGGSTITMQVARNFFLSSKQTFARKFNEILLAIQIEQALSKDEILALYLNKIYLGNRAYGVGAAAQVYFGKKVADLNLSEMALIAGLPKAPSSNNPLSNAEKSHLRRDWILGRMLKLGDIDQTQYRNAIATPLVASYHDMPLDTDAPYVAEMARQFALDKLGESAYTDGYQVITTVDERLQVFAQNAVQKGAFDYDKRHGYRGAEKNMAGMITTNHERLLDALDEIPVIATTQPGVVMERDNKTVTVLLADDQKVRLSWATVRSEWSKYIDTDHLTAMPEKSTDMFKTGDLIRVTQLADHSWHLSQLPQVEAALVSLNPENGAIISLVGGYSFQQSNYNRIVQANRQPGSNFKPFFYTTALENGYTAATLVNDAPIVFDDNNLEGTWRPENSEDGFMGPIRLRKALYMSRNLVSIRLLKALGIDKAVEGATRFGFTPNQLPKNLSLALGSLSVPPLTIATAYATFANGGYKIEPFVVDSILDGNQHIVYKASPVTVCRTCDDTPDKQPAAGTLPAAKKIVDARTVYIMDSILKDVVKKGTATKALSMKRGDIAGKTGTTNGPTDLWFSGYNPTVITTTWVGFDSNANLGRKEYGGSAALPIWMDYMQVALAGTPEIYRPQPDGIVSVRIDEKTGLRAKPNQDGDSLFEIFRSEDVPPEGNDKSTPSNGKTESSVPEGIF